MGSVTDTKGRPVGVPKPAPAPAPVTAPRVAPPQLLSCPTCAGPVSKKADACPKCGHRFRAAGGINMKDPVHAIGVGLAVLFAAFAALLVWASL